MKYSVKEIFYTLQGEGFHSGRPAVFCRFAGCNLWNGREKDRATAICKFCDTDFVGMDGVNGGRYATPGELREKIGSLWPTEKSRRSKPYVVFTGGEPLLQLNLPLIDAMHQAGFQIGVESNGTIPPPLGIDWLCISPKIGAPLNVTAGNELKLVFPQEGGDPKQFEDLDFEHFYLQPKDGPEKEENTQKCLQYCLRNPQWKLSLQTHKYIGIP